MMKTIHFLFFFSIILMSCSKVKKGTQITVSGFVIDTVKNKQLPSAKVYLVGGHKQFAGLVSYYNYVDSTVSDASGNFSIRYRAEGNSVGYVLEIAKDENYGYNGYKQTNFNNGETNVHLDAQELNNIKIHLIIGTNPYDTLYLSTSSSKTITVLGHSIDTTITTKILPNKINYINYRISTHRIDTSFIRRFYQDTITTNLQDPFLFTKLITNTYEIPYW